MLVDRRMKSAHITNQWKSAVRNRSFGYISPNLHPESGLHWDSSLHSDYGGQQGVSIAFHYTYD